MHSVLTLHVLLYIPQRDMQRLRQLGKMEEVGLPCPPSGLGPGEDHLRLLHEDYLQLEAQYRATIDKLTSSEH